MRIAIVGLALTSSWGNGHATTYRALARALAERGHAVSFFERNLPWYASNRDLPSPRYCTVHLYDTVAELRRRHAGELREADLVIVGSYVPEGAAIGDMVLERAAGVTAFYDIDTPVTLASLANGTFEHLEPGQIPRYDMYLSFTGGPILERLETRHGARMARPLYCSVDPALYFPEEVGAQPRWDLGYLGTYSGDRQPVLDRLMLACAREWPEGRFIVAGPQYPAAIAWPANVDRIVHLSPGEHRRFYSRLRYTLNVTREDMVRAGYSPSVRLFEAAACGTPIISDNWRGLDELFTPGVEILLSALPADTLSCLREIPEGERREIGARARRRVLAEHTSAHRAIELEQYCREAGLSIAPTAEPCVKQGPALESPLP